MSLSGRALIFIVWRKAAVSPFAITPPVQSDRDLLTVEEAAERLKLSASALNKWRVLGVGPAFVKLGRRVRYRVADLDDWVAGARRQSTSAT